MANKINKTGMSSPKKGMNRSSHESELRENEYSFALNSNFQDEHGNGQVMLQNEPSNIKCTGFKLGFVVVGHKYDIGSDKTYFLLNNPTTNISEIGYINSFYNYDSLEQVETECDCNISVILENPLEETIQEATCSYYTIANDECDPGRLGFNINFPIFESNIEIKNERLGKTIYITDFNTFSKRIKLNSDGTALSSSYTTDTDDCTGEETPKCLDVDEMRIFRLFDKPCLEVDSLQEGGNLKAGMYEVAIAYSSSRASERSPYYSLTNPIAVFDKNNNILDQTNLDYQTNKAIVLDLTDLDTSYEYYKILVVYHSGLDGAVSYYEYGNYQIDSRKVIISTLDNKPRTDLDKLLSPNVNIVKSKGISNVDGYLVHYGLEELRELNLQPVVNLLGAFAKWSTVQAKEDLYEDGENVSKYKSAMRDEVYPYSIKFFMDGGFETANFPLIPRPPKDEEILELNDLNTQSVLAYNPECSANLRNKVWQFQNTATVEEDCTIEPNTGVETIEEDREVEFSCIVSDPGSPEVPLVVDTLASGNITYTSSLSLVEYINKYYDDFISYTGSDVTLLAIKNILDDATDYAESCTPEVYDNCGNPLIPVNPTEGMFAISVAGQTSNSYSASAADYVRVEKPSTCSHLITNYITGEVEEDTALSLYFGPATVYKRQDTTNNLVANASSVQTLNIPQLDSPRHLQNKVDTSVANLQKSGYTVQIYGSNFTNKLHENVTWYKIDFGADSKKIVEISDTFCQYADANSSNEVRLSFFADDTATTDLATYSTHITDISSFNTSTHFIELDASDFTDNVAYLAIDSPIELTGGKRSRFSISGSENDSGQINIVQGATTTTFSFTIDAAGVAKTADNIIETHRDNILAWTGCVITPGDSPGRLYIYHDSSTTINTISTGPVTVVTYYSTKPPCGCFNIFKRDLEYTFDISFTDLTFGKRQDFITTCTFNIPILGNCQTVPHQKGDFSYWESTEKYPCNLELFDSSSLKIRPIDLTVEEQNLFETYYTDGTTDVDGYYILNSNTVFADKPIRHFKYPDNKISPFMNTAENSAGKFKESIIYPIGFNLNSDTINKFLDVAVNSGLITADERSKITKYEVFRGDRRLSRSVIAKGLAFDMLAEDSNASNIYSNYPLNSLGNDSFNGNTQSSWGNSTGNKNYSFHSPNTHFYKPTLPRELSIEGYVYGNSKSYFDTVEDHPTYTVLGDGAYRLATALAIAESALELIAKIGDWSVLATTGGIGTPLGVAVAITSGISFTLGQTFKAGEYRLQWIKTLYELGHPINHAYYQATVGYYNSFSPNTVNNSTLRGLSISHYLREGMWEVADEYAGSSYNVNNLDREESVFLSFKDDSYKITYPGAYTNYDNTYSNASNASRIGYSGLGRSGAIIGNAASPYVALKQYSPSQYGDIHSIDWISTGFCGDLTQAGQDCDIVLGGDIFISRFAVKRKFPFFTTTAFGLAPLTPFVYSRYFNINSEDNPDTAGEGRFYLNYKLIDEETDEVGIGSFFFPSQRSQYKLDYLSGENKMYLDPESKFYLYSYGFPHFLVESEINCNFRYAKREIQEDFYPNFGDIIRNTQEKNISIREHERFFYNSVYSLTKTKVNHRVLPNSFKQSTWDKLAKSKNGLIVSKLDNSEVSLSDPWTSYDALNTFQFPTDYGDLISIDSLESGIVLARFSNGFVLFESSGNIIEKIASQSRSFNKTDLGYAGSQHTELVSCDFGHFWVDAKRGKVFQLNPGGKGLNEIVVGVEKWFRDNLPFKILKWFPESDIDNHYRGLGISMGWDERSRRLFITKRDYTIKNENLKYNSETRDYYVTVDEVDTIVELGDSEYFEECSWTIAYSPLTKSWISYYSFKPHYYIGYNNYFQTGINFSDDTTELGLWSHLPFISSYQVFYGKIYPYIVEYSVPTKYINSTFEGVAYWLDVRKYYNKWDYTDIVGSGFNKAVVYNNHQNSGLLELIHQDKNNLSQQMNYPKHNSNSISVLQSESAGKWTFNHLYNLVKNERAGLPIWVNDCNQVGKTLDDRLLNYRNSYLDRLRGDYFLVRLTQDKESRYKMIFRFSTDDRIFFE